MEKKTAIVFAALASAFILGFALWSIGQPMPIVSTAAITLFVAILWVTEALPIPATSLIPFALLPLAGALTQKEAATAHGSPTSRTPRRHRTTE